MASDGGLWKVVKRQMPGIHWQRIETQMTAAGVPDVNGCYQGREVWIELKHVPAGLLIRSLSAFQCGWMLKRAKYGGNVWLLVRYTKTGDQCWLYHAGQIKAVKEGGMRVDPHMKFDTNDPEGWAALRCILFNLPYPRTRSPED